MTREEAIRILEEERDVYIPKWIKHIKLDFPDRRWVNALELAIKALDQTRWIPVSERLPEDSGDYLVCGHGKMWICEMINLYGVGGWCNDAKNPTVEAWMPLPKPYKAESEE